MKLSIATLDQLNAHIPGTLMETLGIRYVGIGEDFLSATMPVGPQVHQPMKILHGGASLALAETVASAATHILIDHNTETAVGLELNANHIRMKRDGIVTATARPIHLGRRTHIWEVRIVDEENKLVSVARMTNIILPKNA
jgi:uncharacterized protein (TIGR00369 family)